MRSILEISGRALFILCIAFLAFIGGALVMLTGTFPAETMRDAYRAKQALDLQYQITHNILLTNLYNPARTKARGVTVNDQQLVSPGYTFYTSGDGPVARLIAMDGRVVHEWRRPYSQVWNKTAAVQQPQPDSLIYMTNARLFPNGDVLALYISAGDTPWGYGMVKLDKDSNVLWSYLAHTHHDFDIAPDGRIFGLVNEFSSRKIAAAPELDKPWLDDSFVILSPDGKLLKKVSLTDALARSRYSIYLHLLRSFSLGDPLHTNAIQYITPALAQNFPFAKAGDILVSFRDLSVIAVVDVDRGVVTWATTGPWLRQHDVKVQPDGNIMMFDNSGNFQPGNGSRVYEFDPKTMAVKWTYTGTRDHPLESSIRSQAKRLPNGDTLVTESDGGRVFEVTPQEKIDWEYINPVLTGKSNELIPVISAGARVDPASLDPAFRQSLDAVASPGL
jgi:hypothetical protein